MEERPNKDLMIPLINAGLVFFEFLKNEFSIPCKVKGTLTKNEESEIVISKCDVTS
jgi:hypothetical protein